VTDLDWPANEVEQAAAMETIEAAADGKRVLGSPKERQQFNDVETANGSRLLYAKLREHADQAVPWDNLPDEAFRDRNNVDDDTRFEALRTLRKKLNSKKCGHGQFGLLTISEKNRTATLSLDPDK
jgi:hypothetical protein